jgi:hypothetical protein
MASPPVFAEADRQGRLLPLFWRRTKKGREGVRWHRGARVPGWGTIFAMCGATADDAAGNRIQYQLLDDGGWPEPHCRTCEYRQPGTDALRAFVYAGVTDPYEPVLGPASRRGRHGPDDA